MAKKVKKIIVPIVLQSKVPSDYSDFLNGLKSRIQTALLKAAAIERKLPTIEEIEAELSRIRRKKHERMKLEKL